MNRFDITTQNLRICDKENLYINKDIITAIYDYDFNPDEYFKTEINKPDGNAYLCFATDLNMLTGEISLHYWGEFEGGKKENEKTLTKKEQAFFKKLMKKSCQELYGYSIQRLWKNESQKENIDEHKEPIELVDLGDNNK